MLNFLISIGP